MSRFGKYEVVEKIGEGGFGVIYKGYDPLIKRTVAIKTCTSEDQEIRDRFFQEAEIVGNLQHRNITIVFDFGVEDGIPYLVQEYLTGEDLHHKIRRGDSIPFATQLLYLIQVAKGLQYAHSKGVIHRDIKPSNVRVLEDGTVKIMDFGIAKVENLNQSLTQTGQTVGTAAYLAPEQIRGQPYDHRADIFAFGLLGYELLTGKRAFPGDNPSTVLYKVLTQEPEPITDFWADCPSDVLSIIDRCTEKDPRSRYADCGALLADLNHLLDGRGGQPSPGVVPVTPVDGLRLRRPERYGSGRLPTRSLPQKLEEIPLKTSHETPRTVIEAVPAPAPQRGPRRLFLGALVAVMVIGGTFLYVDRYEPQLLTDLPATVRGLFEPDLADTIADANPSPSTQTAGAQSNREARGNEDPEVDTDGTPGNGSQPASRDESSPAQNATTPRTDSTTTVPPAPDPKPGTLVLPAAWDPSMTVRVAGQRYRLDHQRTLELPAASYELRFELDSGDYSPAISRRVELSQGDSVRVPIPIPAPAFLTLRQAPGSPRGYVRANDKDLGATPIQQRPLTPGQYTIKISTELGGDSQIEQTIELRTGFVKIVTFNLTRPEPPSVSERPVDS